MDWILLNKDTAFLEFSTLKDEFGDVVALEGTWFSSLRPIGYKSLLSFLEGRRAPKHRKRIEQLLAQYGCRTLEGFLQVSHALSPPPHRDLPQTDTMPSAGNENRTGFISIRPVAPPMSWSHCRNIWPLRFPASCAPVQSHTICDSIMEDWCLLVPLSLIHI